MQNIAQDDALILPHRANPRGWNFRERPAVVERGERRATADRHDRRAAYDLPCFAVSGLAFVIGNCLADSTSTEDERGHENDSGACN
jgi:hypothetical protein